MNYHYFIESFQGMVEKNIPDEVGRLTRLIKFTKGEVRALIQLCIHLPPEDGYKTAKALLKKRFGDSYIIMAAYRKEIAAWPTLKSGDGAAFRTFHSFLIKYQHLTTSLTWNELENPDTICRLLTKLPMYMIDRWNRKVHSIRKKTTMEPKFQDFVDFIEEEAELVNDPLFSRQSVEKRMDAKDKRGKLKTFTTQYQLRRASIKEQHREMCLVSGNTRSRGM